MQESSPRSSPKRKAGAEEDAPARKGRRVSLSDSLTLPNIRQYFDQPLKVAAQHLGVSINCLKRACRRLGISRWPYKELRGVRSALAGVPSLIHTAPAEQRAQLEGIIASLKAEEQELLTVGSKHKNMLQDETWESEQSSADAKQDGVSSASSKRARPSPATAPEDEQNVDIDDEPTTNENTHREREQTPPSSIVSHSSPQHQSQASLPVFVGTMRHGSTSAGASAPASSVRVAASAPRPWLVGRPPVFNAVHPSPTPPPPPVAGIHFPHVSHVSHIPPQPGPKLVDMPLDVLRRLDHLENTVAQLVSRQSQLENYVFAGFRAF